MWCEASRAGEPVYDLDIPSMNAAAALNRFAEQTGAIMLFPFTVARARQANAVRGRHTLIEGLGLLLEGTGLSGGLSDQRVVNISQSEKGQRHGEEEIMFQKRKSLGTRIAAFVTMLLSIATAPAQDAAHAPDTSEKDSLVLDEIVVTATKHAEPLRDVPIAITAITSQDIVSRGLTQYADILSSVPGVYYEDAGPGATSIRIRGITPGGGGTPPTVATYFGEIPISAQGGGNLGQHGTPRFVDIERVEVLRGPQGTVFGANALAGAIRVIPAPPNLQEFQYDLGTRGFATSHSNDVSYHLEGMINLPLVPDRLGLRLVGYKDDIAGFIDNVSPAQGPTDYSSVVANLTGGAISVPPGTLLTPATEALDRKDINSMDTTGGRVSAAWEANDRLRFDLMLSTQDAEMNSESTVRPGSYRIARTLDFYARGLTAEDLDLAGITIAYQWDRVSLTSVSSYTKLKMSRLSDASDIIPPMVPWYFQENRKADALTQEVRLASRGESKFKWTVGAFYLDRDTDGNQHVGDYACAVSPPCLPLLFTGGTQDFALNLDFHLFEKQHAVFADTSFEFAPRWTLGLGARYLEEDIGVRLETAGFLAPPPGASNGGKDSVSQFNPAASLRFKPTDDLTLYLQAAEGFRSGVANQALPDICQQQAQALGLTLQTLTAPDTVRNYELGMKSALAGGRVNLNVAAYRLKWKDIPGTVILPCAFSTLVSAGDATGKGVELEMVGRLSASWRVNLAASYIDLNYDDNVLAQIGASGQRVAGSPAKNYSAGVEYDFNVNDAWSGMARVDWAYVGSVRPDLQLGASSLLASYDTLNLRFGMMRDSLALELFGRNVTDKRAISSVEAIQFGGEQTLIRPREVGIEMRYSYK